MISLYDAYRNFNPRQVVRAKSVDEVSQAIIHARRCGLNVRPMGLGYSWSTHVLTEGLSLQMDAIKSVCQVDPDRNTITVDAGCRIGDVTRILGTYGLALPSLPFLSEMTAGGAVSTASHGTSHRFGTLSDFVSEMDVVLASGDVKRFSPSCVSEDEMRAARVAIGMLGVVTRVQFQAVSMPWVRFIKLETDLKTFMQESHAILERFGHVWVHWTLGSDLVEVDCLETSAEPKEGFYPYVLHRNAAWQRRPASQLKEIARPLLNRLHDCIRPLVPTTKARFRNRVRTSMQYSVGRHDWEAAVKAIQTSTFARVNEGRKLEMKFIQGNSRSFLGPNAEQDAVCFNVYWVVARFDATTTLYPFEAIMRAFKARPHWGKDHVAPDRAYLEKAYPQWASFDAVRRRFDKDGIFLTIGREDA